MNFPIENEICSAGFSDVFQILRDAVPTAPGKGVTAKFLLAHSFDLL